MTGGNLAYLNSGYFYYQKNGADIHFTHWNTAASWHYVTLSCIASCAAGDTLAFTIRSFAPAATGGFYGGGGHNMYSIALMA
jgi:hypothetical protein